MKTVNYGYNESHPVIPVNKGGRPTASKTRQQKHLAYDLYKRNISQKEIGKQLGVSEKTIGVWAKEWKEEKNIEAETIANLKKRLLTMSLDDKAQVHDLEKLTKIIQQLETKK